jgi:hypothetical protein
MAQEQMKRLLQGLDLTDNKKDTVQFVLSCREGIHLVIY